jgi:NADH-quinone oxidoreductase subunit L
LFAIEYIVAGLTAFYMFRLYFVVFWGQDRHYHREPHEAPKIMTIPLIILAVASVFTGFIPFSSLVTSDGIPFESHIEWMIAMPSVLIGITGILVAMWFYKKENGLPDKMSNGLMLTYKLSFNKFYIDEIYFFITKKIIFNYISRPVAWFDRHVVDGTMNGVSRVTNFTSEQIKGFQSGQLQKYGFVFVSGVIFLVFVFIYFFV